MDIDDISLEYSTKNNPVPDEKSFKQILVARTRKLVQNVRWKAFFTLRQEAKPSKNEYYGFKSTNPAPNIPELKLFEEKLEKMIKNDKFGKRVDSSQGQLKKMLSLF